MPTSVLGGRGTEESRKPYRMSSGHGLDHRRNLAGLRGKVDSFHRCRRPKDGGKVGIFGRPQALNLFRQ